MHIGMLKTIVIGIEWDDGNFSKCQKHGVSIEEIEEVLHNPSVGIEPDIAHSTDEDRLWAIGRTAEGRGVFVVFVRKLRFDGLWLRPISARYMHQKEIDYYEAKAANV
jgi:uncharacterized DUF497 family protein